MRMPATPWQHGRDAPCCGSDLSDAEWALIAPFMLPPARTGRPRNWPTPGIVNAIFYALRGGVIWRLLPKDFPPMTTVYGRFYVFVAMGCLRPSIIIP